MSLEITAENPESLDLHISGVQQIPALGPLVLSRYMS